jgi:Rrf2 family protein
MHVPIRVDYGVRALVDMALNAKEGPVRAADIARRTAIPEPYLDQVLHTLSRNGLVRSVRGPQGGHTLAMAPSQISLGMVMTFLDGPSNLVGCLDTPGMCVHSPSCAQREVWRTVEDAIRGILNSISIADLAERTRESMERVEAMIEVG